MQTNRRKVISLRVTSEVHEELQALAHKLDEPVSTLILVRLKPLMPVGLIPDWRYYGKRLHYPSNLEAAVENMIQCRQGDIEDQQ